MPYKLSKRSISRLEGVHPDLARVARKAIQVTDVDFGISEGVRTLERQRELVESKASRTMKSRHLPQPHGYGGAIDVYAWVAGSARWELELYEQIAAAFREAGRELGVKLTWGAAWPWRLTGARGPAELVEAYVDLRRSQGRRPFIDGPHFQIEGV